MAAASLSRTNVAPARLEERVSEALSAARRTGRATVAAVTVPIRPDLDLSAAVLTARRGEDRYACLEQPDRDGFVLAALGQAAVLEARGPERFAEVAAAARELGRNAFADDPAKDPSRPPAAGPVFVGGFAFADDGGSAPEWSGLPPACLVLPEVTCVRQGGEARLTLTAVVHPDDDAAQVVRTVANNKMAMNAETAGREMNPATAPAATASSTGTITMPAAIERPASFGPMPGTLGAFISVAKVVA